MRVTPTTPATPKALVLDRGTTLAAPTAGPRNFGHRMGQDGLVRRNQSGQQLVWADNGRQLSIHQLAAMGEAQRKASLMLVPDPKRRAALGHQVVMHGQAERATRPAPQSPRPSAARLARLAELPPRPAVDPMAKRTALVPEAIAATQAAEPGPVAVATAFWASEAKAGGAYGVLAQGMGSAITRSGMDALEADAIELGARSGVQAEASSFLVPLARTAWNAKALAAAAWLGL